MVVVAWATVVILGRESGGKDLNGQNRDGLRLQYRIIKWEGVHGQDSMTLSYVYGLPLLNGVNCLRQPYPPNVSLIST
jgi:hypothetical protein